MSQVHGGGAKEEAQTEAQAAKTKEDAMQVAQAAVRR